MRWGVGIDASLGLTFEESGLLVREAASLGFRSAWCPSGPATRDGFQVCGQWARDTADIPGFECGIAVIPAPVWTVPSLVSQAGTVGEISNGRFILGFGTGGNYSSDFRGTYGLAETPNVALMRDYLVTMRGLLNGETVTHHGKAVTLEGLRMVGKPLPVPLYISALGPQLLRLAGELADGVCLNWTTPAQRQWCRDRIAEGAARSGKDPAGVVVMEYIRVCVDEDEAKARRAFARAIMGYALSRAGAAKDRGYRGHFARMGFDDMLTAIEANREAGASSDELADAFPEEFLRQMGYFGPAAGAREALQSLSQGLDVAVVRIVGAAPGLERARRTIQACTP
jgi:alkanesulfonate monooxygenase SsuD/methylene tetrahydromethanopterin reductase-like flavin-dependent oxidoreductase (luciferase family)